jgi:glutamine---fructose-6-phosphate transaminase (isomerizing)
MCGIVGYVGSAPCKTALLDGLRRLEYRGYDSAGLAIHNGGEISVVRAVGKLANLAKLLEEQPLNGTTGIGHTRWATHGRPSEENAHPHKVGSIALVHNGIIENHLALKQQLAASGVVFKSDTDTEIAAHLVDRALGDGAATLFDAVRVALQQVRGAYAIAVVSSHEPQVIVVAKMASPLVLGLGQGETLCASDIPALLDHTRDVLFLEDHEIAELSPAGARIETLAGEKVTRKSRRIDWSPVKAEKGGFKHFMLKEICEQPRAIADTLRGRINIETAELNETELQVTSEVARRIDRVYFLACGTSFHASLAGRYWVEQLARLPAQAELASEVRYRDPVFTDRDLIVAVSQSGETADTLAALGAAKAAGAHILSVANVLDSAIPRASHGTLYTHAGPEIGVASTKAYTTQLVALLMLAVHLGRTRGSLPEARAREVLQQLLQVPELIEQILGKRGKILKIARRFQDKKHMLYLGRGLDYQTALEGALKLKEISYVHAEAYAAGEMKHGPIALIDESMPVVVVMPRNRHFEKTFSNVQEVEARDGQIIAVCDEGDQEVRDMADYVMEIPKADELVQPILAVVPLQLLAYHIADLKGTDVDQPRNLAKTVTVE